MKTLQKFTPQYLEQCKAMSSLDIVQFLEDFRLLHAQMNHGVHGPDFQESGSGIPEKDNNNVNAQGHPAD